MPITIFLTAIRPALLSNTFPTAALEELHLRAMQALVAELEKRRYAANTQPRGGEHTLSNLALRCRAHNTSAAEEDFGRELIERRRSAPKHEPFTAQER